MTVPWRRAWIRCWRVCGARPSRPPTADPPGELTYGDALSAIIVDMSAGPATWPDLAAQLDAARRRRRIGARDRGSPAHDRVFVAGRRSRSAWRRAHVRGQPARQGLGAWRNVPDRLTGVSFIYGPVLTWWRWAPCASWAARSADRYTGPWNASTKNPILGIGTRFDPNTPYANAAAPRAGSGTRSC